MSRVHDLRSRRGATEGTNTVCGGRTRPNGGEGVNGSPDVEGVGVIESSLRGIVLGVGVRMDGGSGLALPDCGAVIGVFVPDLSCALYWMILKMLVGSLLEVMMVATPAAVAMSAAMSLVSIPPVPRLEPSVVVLTVRRS